MRYFSKIAQKDLFYYFAKILKNLLTRYTHTDSKINQNNIGNSSIMSNDANKFLYSNNQLECST